ncbi:MAG: efflux RND transporter permease subunit [Microscillaceae bacterium]|nr:efflux RND transporter permease subunit [Microscillaceae bacterium]
MLISRISIHNPQFTGVVFLLLLSLGLLSYFTMPRYESPQVKVPGVNLIITYPGASPEDLEDLVVDPIEEAVYEIDNLTKLTSDIRDGFATIRIEFALSEDKVEKNNEVQQKISRVQSRLPEGVNIRSIEFSVSNVQIVQLAFLSKTAGYERMQALAEDLEEEIERLRGVKEVDLEGTVEKRLVVDLDFQKLARYGLSASQVADIIRANNRNIPAGSVRLGQQAFNLQSTHAYRSLEEINYTILKSVQNQPVYVRDVAEVYFRYQDPEYIARAFGQKAVFLSIYPKEDVNALPTIEAVKAVVARFRAQLPADITLKTVFDQSVSINNKVDLLFGNLWQGILVVGVFILLFLICGPLFW